MEAEQYFTNLALAALVDGKLDEREIALLERHAENLRLPSESAQDILNRVATGELSQFVKPSSPEARRSAFKAVVRILRADKVLTSAEKKMIIMLAQKMEIPDELRESALSSDGKGIL